MATSNFSDGFGNFKSLIVSGKLFPNYVGNNATSLRLEIKKDFNITSAGIVNFSGLNHIGPQTASIRAGNGGNITVNATNINILGRINTTGGSITCAAADTFVHLSGGGGNINLSATNQIYSE